MILTVLREGEELRLDEIASFGSFNWFYPPDDGDGDHRDHDGEDDDDADAQADGDFVLF